MTKKNGKEYYSTSEAGEILKVTRKTVFIWVKEGKIKAVMMGGSYMIPAEELDRLAKK